MLQNWMAFSHEKNKKKQHRRIFSVDSMFSPYYRLVLPRVPLKTAIHSGWPWGWQLWCGNRGRGRTPTSLYLQAPATRQNPTCGMHRLSELRSFITLQQLRILGIHKSLHLFASPADLLDFSKTKAMRLCVCDVATKRLQSYFIAELL